MRARAFTIVEIMVVVLIVTAVSAIVLPTLVGRVTGSKLVGAVRAVEFAAALAGAEAMQRGEVIAFVAERNREQWVLSAEPIEPERIGTVFVRDPLAMPPADGPDPELDPRQTRVELAVFDGVEIRAEPLLALMPGTASGSPGADEFFAADPQSQTPPGAEFGLDSGMNEGPERWVLGVFFADGSVRPGPTVYLLADKGRLQRSLDLRPLTGGLEVATIDPFGGPINDSEPEGPRGDEGVPVPPPPAVRGGVDGGSGGGAGLTPGGGP